MTDMMPLSDRFMDASEADWLSAVEKALKGGGIERITRRTRDGITIRPLYREVDFPNAETPRGQVGSSPYLRGGAAEPDAHLPWDIRQRFSHPSPAQTQAEILRDLERGVSSVELAVECSGARGVQLVDLAGFETALAGIRPDIATIALDPCGAGSGASVAALLGLWAQAQGGSENAKLAFNIDPLSALARTGKLGGGLESVFAKTAALTRALSETFPLAKVLRSDARNVHEAGGTEAQELGALMAHAVDTLRRLEAAGLSREAAAPRILFTLSVDANYGIGITKLRAARRLWARVQEALGIAPAPMHLQAVSSARMLTRYDAWTNMLRGTAACFAGAVGGADVVTVQPFNAALGLPEELSRRIARNTHIIAMEESGLGRVADPSGGAWFSETLAEDMAQAAWAEFQTIEAEGGFAESLMSGSIQARITEARAKLEKDVARRKVPVTGVSEFPLLNEVAAPVADAEPKPGLAGVDPAGLKAFIPDFDAPPGEAAIAEPLTPMRLAEPFEALRDRAEAHLVKTGSRPSIFVATLGPLSEHTARADFARNLFAAGGIEAADTGDFKASGCQIAVICGADKRYEAEAAEAANALKTAGAVRVWLAGKFEAGRIDSHVYMGCDVVHECALALAELGVE